MEEDAWEPPSRPAGPPGAVARAYAWVRGRRHSRLWEFLFFALPGAGIAGGAWQARLLLGLPVPLMDLGILAGLGLVGFGLLPPVPVAPAPAPPGRSRRRRG